MIWKFVEPIARAAVITPESTSDNADSERRATKGAAAIESGMIAAVGPMLVLTINLESGISRIIRMMKGIERRMLTTLETALYMRPLGFNPSGDALKRKAPRGKPIRQARKVETRVI